MIEQDPNKDIVRRSFEAISRNDLDGLQELLADDVVLHDQHNEVRGSANVAEYFRQYVDAFPDMRVSVDEYIVDGDTVVARWTGRGTHSGSFLGIEPTGREVVVQGIEIDRIRDGRIAETWQSWDAIGMFQQLGRMPSEAALAG